MGELIDVAAKIAAGFVAHGANSELLQARAGESMVSAVARASLDYAEALISDARQHAPHKPVRERPASSGKEADAEPDQNKIEAYCCGHKGSFNNSRPERPSST